MNILLIYPQYPDTFWSFKHSLKFISKKAAFPPLGLLTVAAMLPEEWLKKLVDLNVEPLSDNHLAWADMVFLSAMIVQKESAREVVQRCNVAGKKVVAGGPVFTTQYEQFEGVDHFLLNEAEITLPLFLNDLAVGRPQRLYTTKERHKFPFALLTEVSANLALDEELMQLMSAANFFNDATGENTDGCLNFLPKMDKETLIEGYQELLTTLYSHKHYYQRINTFIKNYRPTARTRLNKDDLFAFIRAGWWLGIVSKARFRYWKLIIKTFWVKRRALPMAVELAIHGFHFQKVLERVRKT